MFKRIRAWFGAPAAEEPARPAAEPASDDSSGTAGVRIDFGKNEWSGANISFGNVTGGSLIQQINPAPDIEYVGLSPHASAEHLRDLQAVYLKNRDHLCWQIERLGDHAPRHVRLQLSDTERYLAEIERRLDQLSRPAE